jgi:tetratricopeptide (TPR) repeat protein
VNLEAVAGTITRGSRGGGGCVEVETEDLMNDARGVPLSGGSAKSQEIYEQALRALNSYRGDPVAIIDQALAGDPDFAMGHVLRAQVQITMWERSVLPGVQAGIARLDELHDRMNDRERRHARALKRWAAGDWDGHRAELDRLLVEWPRDLLALQVGHVADFFHADRDNLRGRVARALPAWNREDQGYGFLLGMQAFGLEECGAYGEAEEAGRRAQALEADDCWAQHAVAHVMEMQARQEEGIAFMEGRKAHWAQEDNGFAFHNWWHTALYNLDQGRPQRALEIYDEGVRPQPSEIRLMMLDAAALLWRMHLRGLDIGKRWEELADCFEKGDENGFYAFNDMHAMMAFVATGRTEAAAGLLKAVEAAAAEGGTNGHMAREAGLPIVRAIEAFGREKYAQAVDLLMPVRYRANVFGGSHAQRDIVHRTLLEAALRAGDTPLARALAEERVALKPDCPFSRGLRARAMQ